MQRNPGYYLLMFKHSYSASRTVRFIFSLREQQMGMSAKNCAVDPSTEPKGESAWLRRRCLRTAADVARGRVKSKRGSPRASADGPRDSLHRLYALQDESCSQRRAAANRLPALTFK